MRRLGPGTAVAQALAAEADTQNLLALVRAREEGVEEPLLVLPGGRWTTADLRPLVTAADPSRLVQLVSVARPAWRAALTGWVENPDPVALNRDLDAANHRAARRLWITGDALGPGVPVAYLSGVDAEEHDLGLVLAAAGGRLGEADARKGLWAA